MTGEWLRIALIVLMLSTAALSLVLNWLTNQERRLYWLLRREVLAQRQALWEASFRQGYLRGRQDLLKEWGAVRPSPGHDTAMRDAPLSSDEVTVVRLHGNPRVN